MLYFSSIAFMIDDLKNRYGSFHGNPKENKGIKTFTLVSLINVHMHAHVPKAKFHYARAY